VATGVADRVPERLRQVIYLDAFVPRDGQSLFGILGPEEEARRVQGLKDGWQVAPSPIPPDTSDADRAWLLERRHYQPIETVRTPIRLAKGETKVPRSYVYCSRSAPGDVFRQFYDRAQAEGWPAVSIDASHSPHVTAPDLLMRTLADLLV
jgi:pimeloyl-ACP methyl ester carboxylesterase